MRVLRDTMASDSLPERTTDLRLLYALSSSFNAVLDLPELLHQIVQVALKLTNAASGQAALVDPETAQFSIYTIDQKGSSLTDSLGGAVYVSLLTYVITQAETFGITQGQSLRAYGIAEDAPATQLYVPFVVKDRPLGALILTAPSPTDAFSATDRDLLSGLANYAAIAIDNALLYKQALDRSFELSLLVESANSISSSLDLDQVLNAIARHLMRALQTHWCVISSWNYGSGCIRRLADYRSAYWTGQSGPYLQLGEHPIHLRAVQTGKPQTGYLIDDAEGGSFEQASLQQLDFSRILILPLQAEGQIIGLVHLANIHKTEPFSLLEVGQSLRATLEIAHLIRDEHSTDRRSLVNEMARSLCSIAGTNYCTFYRLDSDHNILYPVLAYGTGVWYEANSPEIDVQNLPTLNVVLREQRIAVLRSSDTHLQPEESDLFDSIGPSAMLALPLVFRANAVGLVQLFDLNSARVFSGRELGLARALANQAAVALENAHLVRDLQHSFEDLQSMQGHMVRAARLTALGELSAVVAHQINNPLTTILGDAEMLVQDLPSAGPERESAQAILRAGQRAKRVVERILTMARGDDDARPMNINETVEEMLDLVGQQIRQTGIKLEVNLSKDLPPVLISPGPMGDVWLNLLINARDAIVQNRPSQGRIDLQSQFLPDQQLIEVSVADNGGGIPGEHLDRVFNPFFTTKPHGKGTGLGLYICHQIVLDHNGVISLNSKEGYGTTVSIRLPVWKEEAERDLWQTS